MLQQDALNDTAKALRQAQQSDPPELVVRGIYKLKARNLEYGVWTGSWFIGIREKLGSRCIDGEVLNYPAGTGTATLLGCCGILPDGIEMRERDNPELFKFLDKLES